MAADILLYDSDIVPVGKRPEAACGGTRDLAVKMNLTFGEGLLKVPEARIREATAVVPGLDGQKMSKSYGNTIGFFEDEKALKKKIMGIKTDSTPVEAPKETEGNSILELYRLVASPEEVAAMEADFRTGGIGYGDFKKRLLEKTWAFSPRHGNDARKSWPDRATSRRCFRPEPRKPGPSPDGRWTGSGRRWVCSSRRDAVDDGVDNPCRSPLDFPEVKGTKEAA